MQSQAKASRRPTAPRAPTPPEPASEWTFLTNHAHVLLSIAADPDIRLRDVAVSVGITERAAQRIVMELEQAGFLERERVGRRNRYRVHTNRRLRHPKELRHQVGELLGVLSEPPTVATRASHSTR